jgi:hypothetical protein
VYVTTSHSFIVLGLSNVKEKLDQSVTTVGAVDVIIGLIGLDSIVPLCIVFTIVSI